MGKNYGPSVSGYLDPTGRNWETVVFEAGKPVLDKELNLGQDIAELRATASGWLAADFLDAAAGSLAAIFTSGAAGSIVAFPNLRAEVNGWVLNVANTEANGSNTLTLPAPPIGAGVKRTDVVVLECWRRLLSAAPDATGKSPTALIWRDGNVKIAPADDAVLNYPDDIKDVVLGSESTKRVQIQFRLRVLTGVDLFAYPYALNDPSVVANSVPAAPGAPDGVLTAFGYTNQSASGDPGLWRAGDGNPANTLGTVDGFMYAIPLMGFFRRNSTAFAKDTNHNGGVASPGPSDRPDGLFCDVVTSDDIADLRSGIGDWDYEELLDKNLTYLFDNALRSEWEQQTIVGGGVEGHTMIWADEIGPVDTAGANLIGDFDASRRIFSDRPVLETVTIAIPAPGGGWLPGSTVTFAPTALPVYPYAGFNWAAFNDGRVLWVDITRAEWIGQAALKKAANAMPFITSVTGLGVLPVGVVSVTVGAIGGLALSDETLYVDLLVAYPPGLGLTKTPVAEFSSKSFMVNNPLQMPNVAPVWCDPAQLALDGASGITYLNNSPLTAFDETHREVRLTYRTSNLTLTMAADSTGASQAIPLPERALTIVSVAKGAAFGGPFVAVAGPTTLSTDGRLITVAIGDASAPGDFWQVVYAAVRPMPQNTEEMTIFYRARAPQTARNALLGVTKTFVPRFIPKQLHVITAGSGSPDEGYPFPQAYVQTGGIFPSLADTYAGEHELQSGADISTATFNATTGLLALPTYVNYTPDPDAVVFNRAGTDFDAENRTFFPSVGAGYLPNAFSQDLSDQKRHKVVLPFIAELTADSTLGYRGQLVMVLLIRWAKTDETNGVFFDTNLNVSTTSASVFRLRNNLLNRRA